MGALLKTGASPSPKLKKDGSTPLHISAFYKAKDLGITRASLQHEADVNAKRDDGGSTPIFGAIVSRNESAVELLLTYGSRLDIRGSKNDIKNGQAFTPPELAKNMGFTKFHQILKGVQSKKEEADRNGAERKEAERKEEDKREAETREAEKKEAEKR